MNAPGVTVAHSPARTRAYIGSPGIAVLPGGAYLGSHDLFGPGTTNDRTCLFRSTDRGRTWTSLVEIAGQWWSTLFVHHGDPYLLGTSREYGQAVIRKSLDGGETWTEPKDGKTGLLLADGKYHCAPVPVIAQGGRLWRAMEDAEGSGGWGRHFRAFMLSAPERADLLRAESWTASNRIARDPSWLGGKFGGWLEGNAVATPEGKIVNLLRVDLPPGEREKAARIAISDDGKTAAFDPANGFFDFPGGAKKFTIRHDPISRRYWTLTNAVPEAVVRAHPGKAPGSMRNTLALAASPDLWAWEVRTVIASHPDVERHGFQYVDWLFDGPDIIALVRTADDDGEGGAHNYHDANFLRFHRIENFRRK